MVRSVITDLRYGWRMTRRAPVVTLSVTVAIALGIAASTAIFSVMEGVFLRPLPFPAPRTAGAVQHDGRQSRQRAGSELPGRAGLEGGVNPLRRDWAVRRRARHPPGRRRRHRTVRGDDDVRHRRR